MNEKGKAGGARVALDCLGCKLNQAEMERLGRELTTAGYEVVSLDDNPDVYILNTCTVTHIADRKSRHLLRMARRRNPSSKLVALGCYAERSPAELARLDGVDLVLGNDAKADLVARLEKSGCLARPESHGHLFSHTGRTRAFIKIQEGCRNFCAYCIVPLVRGEEKSLPADEVIGEVKQAAADGYQEVVLTGTKVGSYEGEGLKLTGLLTRILAETGISRLRLSSIQPQEISPGLVELWRDGRLCPHFHLSLQSGSGAVLKRMNRRYSVDDYREAVTLIREKLPDAAITTDIIVGFPGETGEEFEASYRFCRAMGFARIHVFPYSARTGTAAAEMPGQVPDEAKQERTQQMLALAKESAENFHGRFIGKALPVLWEKRSGGIWSGLTGNYIKVYARTTADLTNRLLPVKLDRPYRDGTWGEVSHSQETML